MSTWVVTLGPGSVLSSLGSCFLSCVHSGLCPVRGCWDLVPRDPGLVVGERGWASGVHNGAAGGKTVSIPRVLGPPPQGFSSYVSGWRLSVEGACFYLVLPGTLGRIPQLSAQTPPGLTPSGSLDQRRDSPPCPSASPGPRTWLPRMYIPCKYVHICTYKNDVLFLNKQIENSCLAPSLPLEPCKPQTLALCHLPPRVLGREELGACGWEGMGEKRHPQDRQTATHESPVGPVCSGEADKETNPKGVPWSIRVGRI